MTFLHTINRQYFNVLICFDSEFSKKALEWAPTQLYEGGLFVIGMNWAHSRGAQYSVYQSEKGTLCHREFAISIDNLRPLEIIAWFTLHAGDYETIAMVELVKILRNDLEYIRSLDQRMDELLADQDFCARKDSGYLGGLAADAGPETVDLAANYVNNHLGNEGYVDAAVDALNKNGLNAWVNSAGHIAIDPGDLEVKG